jgi:hypothetical protein
MIFSIRAFVVRVAPQSSGLDRLRDVDHDGAVTAADAEAVGRELLSNEVVLHFHQVFGAPCGTDLIGRSLLRLADLDGNGEFLNSQIRWCADRIGVGSPLGVVRIPR